MGLFFSEALMNNCNVHVYTQSLYMITGIQYINTYLFIVSSILAGSISFSILSGKVMFRDVCYITKDLSLR